MKQKTILWLSIILTTISFRASSSEISPQTKFLYSDDSVLVFVSRTGYEVDVVNPGRYVTVSNFSGQKVTGKFYILNRRTILVGKTVVPITHIKKISIKSSMYPVSMGIKKAGMFFLKKVPSWVFNSLTFQDESGFGAFLMALLAVVFMIVGLAVGLLLLLIALPGLVVSKTYDTKKWKIYIKPRRN